MIFITPEKPWLLIAPILQSTVTCEVLELDVLELT